MTRAFLGAEVRYVGEDGAEVVTTGGDITLAPSPVRIPGGTAGYSEYVALRDGLDRKHLPFCEATIATLSAQSVLPIDGPLTWLPP